MTAAIKRIPLATLIFMLWVPTAHAQSGSNSESEAQDPAELPKVESIPDTPVAPSDALEVITVTSQKRTQDVQDVPSSVTVLSSEQYGTFRAAGGDIRALSARVPSLIIESSFGRSFPRMYIRGLGNTDFDLNASQPVSLVVDEVVLENPIVKSFPIFDIDRVEVLRGPQGTLFGRNTPAGVVKVDTMRPTEDVDGYAKVGYGSFNLVTLEGAAGGSILDGMLKARVSGMFQRRDDWVDNTLTTDTDQDLEGFTQGAARLQVAVNPFDNFELLLNAHYHNQDSTARVFRANIIEPGTADFTEAFVREEVQHDGQNQQDLEQYGGSARIDYDFGLLDLTAIYAYERAEIFGRGDIDGGFGAVFLPESGPGVIPFASETADAIPAIDQHTAELRLSTDNLPIVNGQAGFFYFNEDLNIESTNFDSLDGGRQQGFARQRQQAEAFAFFGTVRIEPIDTLHIQAGVRYTNDQKDFEAERTEAPLPQFGGVPLPLQTTETSADFVSWDASITYDLLKDISVYAKVARGFRAPSIQGRVLFGDTISVADTESVISVEGGAKTRFLNNRAQVNLTGYYYEISDQQLTAVGGGANFNTLINADTGIGYGAELDASFLPITNLLISLGGSYNYTEIQDDDLEIAPCGAPCSANDMSNEDGSGALVSINGNSLPHAPEWIFNANATYSQPLGDFGELYLNADIAYRSEVFFFLDELRIPELL
ncbi:MAG: TonB-dependent receptor [Myxococcota bacterium]